MTPWISTMQHYCSFYDCGRETWRMAFDIKIKGRDYVGDVVWDLWKDDPSRSGSALFVETFDMTVISFIYGPLPTFTQLGPN